MAAYTLLCTRKNGAPIARQAIAAAEDTVTVDARAMPLARAKLSIVTTTSGLLFTITAGTALANGFPVAAGVPFPRTVQHGDIFYVAGTGAGFIDFIVEDN